MSLTITVSGPQASRTKALKALKDAGLYVVIDPLGDPSSYDWGHTDNAATEMFLTVEGDDVNRVVEVLPANWRLRSHRDTPEAIRPLSVEERLAAVGLTAADLRSVLGAIA